MALLLPAAERVDGLANEIFWRSLSLRISMTGESEERLMADSDVPHLVDFVHYYDGPLAAHLLEPALTRLVSRSYSGMPTYIWVFNR